MWQGPLGLAKLGKGLVCTRVCSDRSRRCSFEGVVVGVAEGGWRIDGAGKDVQSCA